MGIFDTLKNAIFGHASAAQTAPPSGTSSPSTSQAASPAPAAQSSATAPSGGAAPAGSQSVDVEAVLEQLKAKNGQNLNWRTSIVDLMKLVGIDSSLQHRKDLAKELGYTGSTDDSATMNVWLHKQVMTRLAQNGGKVPDALLH